MQVLKLSDAVQSFPRSVTEFVHGVPRPFLERGDAMAEPPQPGPGNAAERFSRGAYFIGKGVWGKVTLPECRAVLRNPHQQC